MTKRQLRIWLENKKDCTLAEHHAQYRASSQQLMDETYAALGLPEVAEQIQLHLKEAKKLWESWKNQTMGNEDINFCLSYLGLDRLLNSAADDTGAVYQHIANNDIRLQSAAAQNLRSEEQQRANNIRRTYYDVLNVVDSMNTSKEAEAYLTTLGFDLTEKNETPESSSKLADKVDPSYLFNEKAA